MRPGDLGRFVVPSDPSLHPDGSRIAFVVTRADPETDLNQRAIWLWDGAAARPFTAGPGDTRPRWSPDGRSLAFLRRPTRTDPSVVCVIPADGGEPVEVTALEPGATEAEWSPDGSRIAVVASTYVDEWDGLDDVERERKPRRFTRAYWRADNLGWLHDRRSQVWLVDPGGGEAPVLLTPGDYDDKVVAWHPGGERLAFISARHPERGLDAGRAVWEVPATGGEPRLIVDTGLWEHVAYRPDGTLHVVGRPRRWDYPSVPALFRVEADGTLTDLTGHLDRSPLPFTPTAAPPGPQWAGGDVLTLLEDDGRVMVVRIGADGSATRLGGGDRAVSGFSATPGGTAFALVASTPTDPGELHWWEDGEERPLTDLNAEFRETTSLVEPEEFTFACDGTTIRGWAYLPPGEEPLPLLLNVHGGPASQYGWAFFDEFQVYAGAGYGVVACNPRGSSGRGRDFVTAVVGRWMEARPPDMEDLLAAVDTALEAFPRLDRGRIGVMGGSYGGYATLRLLALDDRFCSAVVERCLASFTSFSGTSDIGPWFDRMYLGTEPPDGWADFWAASPLAHAHAITTPTLVVHSDADYRTPIEQGEQVFTLLLRLGVPTEMVRFPGESHELSRSGKPRHRVERLEAILDWHDRHLR